jgi:DNA-binding transcriptional LysR family regulator
MDRLTELTAFLAVIDHGGFTPAARALRKSPPTITRHVAELEARLGIRLFDRSSRRCLLTEQGVSFAHDARAVVSDYEHAIASASGEATEPRGSLRLTAPYFFGREHVSPAVLRFLKLHPLISIELDLSDRVLNLHDEGIDLAIRIGSNTDETLINTRVGWVRRVIVASPDYIAQHGVPRSPKELAAHTKLQHGSHSDASWRLKGPRNRSIASPVQARFTVNQADAAIAAARSGYGLVTALSYQVHHDLETGMLVRVLQDFEPDPLPVSLTWPEGRERLLRVRLVIDHLAQELRSLSVISMD